MRCRSIVILLLSMSIVLTSAMPDPCLDGRHDSHPEKLKLPKKYGNLTAPWQREDGSLAEVIRSDGLVYQWGWVKALKVKGFKASVEDVISFLNKRGCLFVGVGSFVRTMLLGQKAVYISGEVSCELHTLYDKCIETFGPSGCALYPIEDGGWGAYRMEIGDSTVNGSTYQIEAEPIVLYEWRSILGAPPSKWRFTVDTMALFDTGSGDIFVIDPLRKGYTDTCEKKLIPTENDWDKWSSGQSLKLMGLYDLLTDSFSSQNETFLRFVNNQIKSADKKTAQKFYCEHVLKGVANLEGSTPVCHTKYPEKEAAKKIGEMRKAMINQMGQSWNESIGKASEELEAVFCTTRQFVDIRARLLHKVTAGPHVVHHTTEAPKIIEEGRPMINDSAQVHTRPILDMAENVPELPQEYPSIPRAQPNDRFDFVEPPLVDGAGSEPEPVAYEGERSAPEELNSNSASSEEIEEPEAREEREDATRIMGGTPAEPTIDFTRHNQMNDDIPVMRFDKVEEGGLSDAAASVQRMSSSKLTSSAFIFSALLAFLLAF